MLQGFATLVGSAAVLVAAKWGADTFGSWRRQKVMERHIEQAERILTATYKARRAFKYVRRPMTLAYELTAAEEKLKENADAWRDQPDDRRKRLVSAQAFLNRLNAVRQEQEDLTNCLPMARALFGEHVEKAVESLNHQFWIIQVDAESYVDDDGSDQGFTRKIRRGMYDIKLGENEVNEVTNAIETAVETIENACLPTLRFDETPTQRIDHRPQP